MNKNTKILLIASIIIFVLAIIIFSLLMFTSRNADETYKNTKDPIQENTSEEFSFIDLDGKKHTIQEFTRLGTAIIFWRSDAANSLSTLELINKYYETYKNDIHFLVINTEEPYDDIQSLVAEFEYSFPLYFDTENLASKFYTLDQLPTLIFIEKNNEMNIISGGIDEDTLTANLDILAENY